MSRTAISILAFLAWVLVSTNAARGGAVQFELGEQDFADGKTPVYSAEIREAGQGEAFPFDGSIFGHDVKASGLGAFDYLHEFDLAGRAALSAKLTLGLIDIDSPGDQPVETVALTLDGVSQPPELLTGISALESPSSVEVVEIPVPLELLVDGALHVSVTATRPGYGNLGNAIEADFSRLAVEVAPLVDPDPVGPVDPGPQPIPLPPAVFSAGLILALLAARRPG
jgi:hypothetical protein